MTKRLVILIFSMLLAFQLKAQYKVRFIITETCPIKRSEVFISGSFNNWDSLANKRYQLSLDSEGKRSIELLLPEGEYTYKYTGGNWPSVEKSSKNNRERPDRIIKVTKDLVVKDTVVQWRDLFVKNVHMSIDLAKADTTKLALLSELAYAYQFDSDIFNTDSALKYIEKTLHQLQIIKSSSDLKHWAGYTDWLIYIQELNAAKLHNLGNYPKALELRLENLRLSEKSQLPNAVLNTTLCLIEDYLSMKDYLTALGYSKKLQKEIARTEPEKEFYQDAFVHVYQRLTESYYNLGFLDSALLYAAPLFTFAKSWNLPYALAPSGRLIGDIYSQKEMRDSAFFYYRNAHSIAIKSYNSPEHFRTLVGMAKLFSKAGRTDSALFYARSALEIIQLDKINLQVYGDDTNTFLAEVSPLIAELYKVNGQLDSAYKYLQLSITSKDSLFNINKARDFQNMSFNESLRQLQVEQQARETRQGFESRIKIYVLITIMGAILILAIILYRNNKQEQKANSLLASQKNAIEVTLKELRSTQAQLIQSEKMATLAQQAEAFRLKELDAVKTKLYTNITHEFRTPLTVILGVASQVLDNPNEDLKKGLRMIMRNGQNLLTLVNQMLDLSKLESGKLSLQYHHADVISFLGYIVDSFHSLAESKDIQIHFISVKDQLNMDFDEVRLQQVVSNILSNAIKFTPSAGHVYVSTDTLNESFILKIKDTGIGIDEADIPNIFDRFFQADDSQTRRGEGTGIGLALTHELVKLMKGTIAVKSKKGQGAEFEVVLPIRNISGFNEMPEKLPFVSMDAIHDNSIPFDEGFESSLVTPFHNENSGAHVLIADDNEDVLAFVASCLENEFTVELAKNGQDCENMAFDTIPDLIVLDVMMPFKDGFEVCKTLKSDERTSHIPIILLTAKADLESKLQGLEQGADDYLTKPFNKKELLSRIKNLLELRRQLQQFYRLSLESSLLANPILNPGHPSIDSRFNGSKSASSGNQNPSIPLASSLENAFVIKVRKTIETHLNEPNFDVEKLCRSLALSHSQVHRKLSALTGLSATHFIRYVRLIKAKEMILNSGFSINAIAYDCGFNDPGYFGRIFKKEFGISPQVWRGQNST